MMSKWLEWSQTRGGWMASGLLGGLLAVSVAVAGDEQRREVMDAEPRHEVLDAEPRTDPGGPDDEARHAGHKSEQRHEVGDAEPRTDPDGPDDETRD